MGTNKIVFVNLRAELGRKQLTIDRIAKELGMNRDTLSRKLRGKTHLTLEDAFALKNRYFDDLSIEYLFSKKD